MLSKYIRAHFRPFIKKFILCGSFSSKVHVLNVRIIFRMEGVFEFSLFTLYNPIQILYLLSSLSHVIFQSFYVIFQRNIYYF